MDDYRPLPSRIFELGSKMGGKAASGFRRNHFPGVPKSPRNEFPLPLGWIKQGFDHGGIHPQLDLPPISQKLAARIEQGGSQVRISWPRDLNGRSRVAKFFNRPLQLFP